MCALDRDQGHTFAAALLHFAQHLCNLHRQTFLPFTASCPQTIPVTSMRAYQRHQQLPVLSLVTLPHVHWPYHGHRSLISHGKMCGVGLPALLVDFDGYATSRVNMRSMASGLCQCTLIILQIVVKKTKFKMLLFHGRKGRG